ncbi:MAG: proprotein convertase P-domain-containing protein [Kofleriaceae bacterium]
MNLGLLLLGSTSLLGCAADSGDDEEECLPGDIDCAPADVGGKGDGFEGNNDPSRVSSRLNYRLAELPKKAQRTEGVWAKSGEYAAFAGKAEPVWADTYWPTSEGSHNNRWQGASKKSPLELYDAAFNSAPGCAEYPSSFYGSGAKAEWDRYYTCAGPAAKWQSQQFQGGGEMHDGIDNDGDGKVDEYGTDGIDGIAGWWGTCHAWSPAAQMVPEPQHAVTVNGVTFETGDIKALAQNAFDSTSAIMVGGRCNQKEIEHGPTGSQNSDCRGVNPGSLHVIMTNFIGLSNVALVEDRTANYEVWNQPVVGYEVTKQAKITAKNANLCVGATGDTWTYNTAAKELYEAKMTVTYLTEGSADTRPLGMRNNLRTDNYHYILELNSAGKILGGRYCTDTENNPIDFLWAPTGRFNSSNPNVSVTKVKELILKGIQPATGGGTGPGREFTGTGGAIPDNDPTGASLDIPVTGVTAGAGLTVALAIKHTYRGDLLVDLYRDGTKVKTLSANTGGSTDDINDVVVLTATEVGTPNGRWTVKVVDNAAQDTGTIGTVTLNFQ